MDISPSFTDKPYLILLVAFLATLIIQVITFAVFKRKLGAIYARNIEIETALNNVNVWFQKTFGNLIN